MNNNPTTKLQIPQNPKTMLLLPLLISISLLSFPQPSLSSSSFSSSPYSIYDILKSHGLPMGIFPKGVTQFTIDSNGYFEVHLDKACNAKFESQLHYDQNVSGTLSYGQIGSLSGVSAQELFLWFPVKGIRVDIPSSGIIYFDVGVVFKQFSLSLFESPPKCVETRGEEFEGNLSGEWDSENLLDESHYQIDRELTTSNVM